jgi:dynein heavy chain
VNLFDKAFNTTENLPQLEPLVLDWAAKPMVQGVHQKDPQAKKYRSKLITSIRKSVTYLEEYQRKFLGQKY